MDNNRDRMGKEHSQQHRSSVFKLLRRRRNPPTTFSSSPSTRLADHQNKNRDSLVPQTKTSNRRSKSILSPRKKN